MASARELHPADLAEPCKHKRRRSTLRTSSPTKNLNHRPVKLTNYDRPNPPETNNSNNRRRHHRTRLRYNNPEMTDKDILLWEGVRLTSESLFQGVTSLESAMEKDRDNLPLQELKSLVTPLERHTDPGDLLVFCPSNYLHQIPLHALELSDGEVLIHRNPITYCYSLSVLKHNFLADSAPNEETTCSSFQEVALFGDIAEDKPGPPRFSFHAGRKAIQELGDWFGVTPLLGFMLGLARHLEGERMAGVRVQICRA